MKKTLLLVLFGMQSVSHAFLPPVANLIRDAFDGRKPVSLELILRHKFTKGDVNTIDEKLIAERGKIQSLFNINGSWVPASREAQGYVMSREWQVPSHSGLVLRNLTSANGDSFRDALLNERFIRREQLLQYKPSFVPQGDPAGWNLKENYIRHDDIGLKRVGDGVSVMVVGTNPGEATRAVYLSKDQPAVTRLEWDDNGQTVAWNFTDHSKIPGQGYYPRRMSLEMSGETVVLSEIVVIRELKDGASKTFRNDYANNARNVASSTSAEGALSLLLSYR